MKGILIIILLFVALVKPYTISQVGCTKTSAAFLNVYQQCETCPIDMIITSFGLTSIFGSDVVEIVKDVGSKLSNFSNVQPELITNAITWPNEVTQVPNQVFNQSGLISVGGGFLVPGSSTGAVNIIALGSNTVTQISTDKFEWFYHLVHWKDMNGDGLLDAVAARATKPLIDGSPQGELVWMQQPSSSPFTNSWNEHTLFSGPDFFYRFFDIDGDGNEELLAPEYFSSALIIYWTTNGNWNDPSSIQSVVVDNTIGPLFDAYFVDLNNDGNVDILATNHINNASLSGVYAYEIPQNWRQGGFKKHVIASGFPTLVSGYGQASPGAARTFWVETKNTGKIKPDILLGGDGSEYAYWITANSQSSSDWTYSIDQFFDAAGTVGQVLVGDVNGDGISEVFVPAYDTGYLCLFEFSL